MGLWGDRARAAPLALVLLLSILVPMAGCAAGGGAEADAGESCLQRYSFEHAQMGTRFSVILYACSLSEATEAADAAFARVDELNQTLSDYIGDSELSRLSAEAGSGRDVPVSDDLWAVLLASERWWTESNGAFDITIRPVVRLWRRARQDGRMPRADRLEAALALVGFDMVTLKPDRRTARLDMAGMQLDVGGIGKGYATDAALAVLRDRGIDRALVTGGGGVSVGAAPPDARGWRIALRPMVAAGIEDDGRDDIDFAADSATGEGGARFTLIATDLAVATSGDAFQHVVIDGVRYSHIVDPRTGMGLTPPIGVTVIAPDGTTADALSTAVSILGPEDGLALVDRTPGAAALVVRVKADGTIERRYSSRFEGLPLELSP